MRRPTDPNQHEHPGRPPGAEATATVTPVVGLVEAGRLELGPAAVGTKAATLGRLAAAGFPVPPGFVVPAAAVAGWPAGMAAVQDAAVALAKQQPATEWVRFAVRSSAAAEDLPSASFAGQYESVLDVGVEGLPAAVGRVVGSAAAARVAAYRRARAAGADPASADARAGPATPPAAGAGSGMAVLVQVMVPAVAAGVAFTADPVSGARDEAVVTAARGLGERLVAGEAQADEWVVDHGGQATCRRAPERAIDAAQAAAVAALARRVQQQLRSHQDVEWDIEWAIADGRLFLLQARPMTALPDPVSWAAPGPGHWRRNFRLGEWLPEPMTPLFADWLLPLLEGGYLQGLRRSVGAQVAFRYAAVNGWYYTATPQLSPGRLLGALVQSRGRLPAFLYNALIRVGRDPAAADRALLGALAEAWRRELLPRYQALVHRGERQVGSAAPAELVGLVEAVGAAAGEQFFSLAIAGGSAWKMEGCLARFYRRHLAATVGPKVGGSALVLLRGLDAAPVVPPHAVQSLDWYHPTVGELGWATPADPSPFAAAGERHRRLAAERQAAEAACRAALAGQPALLARFTALLEVTQRYAAVREQQAAQLTLGWPLLRRCVLRLGESLHAHGAIQRPKDAFFLTRAELTGKDAPLTEPLTERVARRRATWERQRRTVAPLTLGTPPRLIGDPIATLVRAVRADSQAPDLGQADRVGGVADVIAGRIVGQPASPGRATGPVRVIRSAADFDRFARGEVLVAPATTPAWTPLFDRAAAVVTDGGTLAAHASLVAREYGIPAVVATGDATSRLRDGQVVTVDGSAGVATPQQEP